MGLAHSPRIVTDGLVLCLDAANQKSFSPNVFPGALDLYTWYFTRRGNNTGNSCTVAQDNSTSKSPAGGIPMRMDVTGTDPHLISYNSATWNISAASNGQTWTLSVYVKGSVATTGQLFLFGADSTGVSFVGGNWLGIAAKSINITTDWVRHDLSITFNNASIAYIHMRLDGPDSGGTGQSIWWDGLQLELGSAPTTFNPRLNTNGTNWTDLSGNGRNGTINGSPAFTNGYFSITGDTTYISIPNAGLVPRTNDFTYSCWVYFNSTDSTDTIFENGSWTDTLLFRYESTKFTVYAEGAARGTFNWTAVTGSWVNIILRRLSGTTSCFINNVLTGTPFSMTTDIDLVNPNLWLMRSQHAANQWTNGRIAIFSIYNKALTDAEIQQNFNALRGRFGI